MEISVLGIDLAKDVFQLHGVDHQGRAVLTRRLRRADLLPFVANLPACLIGMESCCGAHHWAREFQKLGHEVRLIAPQFVKPFVKSNKNDARDAEAIAEAITRPSMRFVSIKQSWQQDLQALHRIRSRLVRSKTALANELRGFLQEQGVVLPQSFSKLTGLLGQILDHQPERITPALARIAQDLLSEMRELDGRIEHYDTQIEAFFKSNALAQRIEKIEGIGVLTATALIASIGDARAFKNGRQLSAYLGLVPKQYSSGGKNQLLGISKRGDPYLRWLLIHGARAVLLRAGKKSDARSRWVIKKAETRGHNRACVALANKNARIVWALLSKGEEYKRAA